MDEKQLVELSPGYGFHPTEEQLVKYYLKRKLLGKQVSAFLIPEVDIYKFAPWDLPRMAGSKGGDQSKLYFFCPGSNKYKRANQRCNDFGYWRTTGRDRPVRCNNNVVAKKRTLVFHRGRTPSGERTDWIMHEYRIEEKELDGSVASPEWLVLCAIFSKNGLRWKTDILWNKTSRKIEEISNDDMSSQDVLTAAGCLLSPASAFPENLLMSCQDEAMQSSSYVTSEIMSYCFSGWSLDRDTSDLFPFDDLFPVGTSECKDKKTSENPDIWVSDYIGSTNGWQKVRDNIKQIIYSNRGYRGPVVYQQEKDSSLQGLGSQAFSCDTAVFDPVLLVDSGIYASTGAEEKLVNCRTSDSAGRLPSQYLRKLVDLLLVLTPSRTLTPSLRAECFVKVYLPGSHNALLQDLVNLKHLDLSYSSFVKMPDLSKAWKLQNLDLHGCNNLIDVSFVQYLTKLEYINLEGCTSLISLPSLMALKFLCSLDVSNCNNLRRLPPSLGCLSSLTTLDLRNCKRIQNLPKGVLRMKSLQTLLISGCSMLMEHASRVPTTTFVNQGIERMLIEQQENPIAHSSLHTLAPEEISTSYPQEEIICYRYYFTRSEDAAKPSSTAQDLERIAVHHPVTSPSRLICDNSDTTRSLGLSAQHREVLERYMSMPVEAIHQNNALYDVRRTVETLKQRSSDSHESASLQDMLYCLEKLMENVPATMARMHDARVSKEFFESTLAHIGSSFVRAEERYSLLAGQFLVITDQEEELDAEIDRLLAQVTRAA